MATSQALLPPSITLTPPPAGLLSQTAPVDVAATQQCDFDNVGPDNDWEPEATKYYHEWNREVEKKQSPAAWRAIEDSLRGRSTSAYMCYPGSGTPKTLIIRLVDPVPNWEPLAAERNRELHIGKTQFPRLQIDGCADDPYSLWDHMNMFFREGNDVGVLLSLIKRLHDEETLNRELEASTTYLKFPLSAANKAFPVLLALYTVHENAGILGGKVEELAQHDSDQISSEQLRRLRDYRERIVHMQSTLVKLQRYQGLRCTGPTWDELEVLSQDTTGERGHARGRSAPPETTSFLDVDLDPNSTISAIRAHSIMLSAAVPSKVQLETPSILARALKLEREHYEHVEKRFDMVEPPSGTFGKI
ncbi:hypothetical protein Slin15195_G122690 [Septoria linicola]|uniref:Uncharacterized protein n=1 Tax=Septoria linicola TaxID=215465 RepID=A0A9Q9EQB4_9PEZI|nr:hypothetical protein Slin14017_G078890 [Septoria linicola]USW58950.1 hypothetical protein Slin15195_G122690 [Septoria linicola]